MIFLFEVSQHCPTWGGMLHFALFWMMFASSILDTLASTAASTLTLLHSSNDTCRPKSPEPTNFAFIPNMDMEFTSMNKAGNLNVGFKWEAVLTRKIDEVLAISYFFRSRFMISLATTKCSRIKDNLVYSVMI
jgi:hypothetical protein